MSEGELYLAAQSGDVEALREYLSSGGDLGAGALGEELLLFATTDQHTEFVRILIAAGVDPNARSAQLEKTLGPPLKTAIRHSNEELVELLMEAGADVKWDSKEGNALMLAIE